MRICISGTGCQGKSTLIKDFLEKWPNYTTPKKTYRNLVKKKKLPHSSNTNKDTQWAILNNIIDELQKHDKDSKVIYDRGPLDNLVYTLYAYSKGDTDIDDKFVGKTIELVKESLKHIDINFLIPITKFNDFDYTQQINKQKSILDKTDCVDEVFIKESNSIFQAIKTDWETNPNTKFFDVRDMPAIIEIFGAQEQRIQMVELYIDADGELIDDTSVLNELDLYEQANLKDGLGIEDEETKAIKNIKGYQ